ncbi:hypothetical protein ACFVIM_23830 [Streptomyces sp. NPDC057638]|uniref:hypothetical protein n=1 Tax=Streptomyces sp. NPDC057638 TaxID=3346190 RepID=UPI0036CFB740
MPRRRAALLITTTALAILLVPVAITSRQASAPFAQEPLSPPVPVTAHLVLPFDAHELSGHEIETVESAEDRLIGDCMRAQSLPWKPLPPLTEGDTDPPHLRRYGLADPYAAARYGYHVLPPTLAQQRRAAVRDARARLPARQRRAAYGADGSTGGCRARAHARMLRHVRPSSAGLLAQYSAQTFDTARRHPDVTAANRRWSHCMKRSGHPYSDPYRAFADTAWQAASRPSAHEKSVAQADVRCKQQTGFLAVWIRTDRHVQRAAIQAQPAHFRAFAQTRTDLLATARHVLHTSSSLP